MKWTLCLVMFFISLNIKAGVDDQYKAPIFENKSNLIKVIKTLNKNNKYGVYSKTKLRVKWLNSGRKVKLLETISFTDRAGKKWVAPKGHIVDGASIPFVFRPIIGTPYGGRYTMASVIHDVACDEKKSSWQDVHEAFHSAMLASGVSKTKANAMYRAVYEGGPRWGEYSEKPISEKEFKKLIARENFAELVGDFQKEYNMLLTHGEIKPYSGTVIYVGNKKGSEAIAGLVKKINDLSMHINLGGKKVELGIKYGGKEAKLHNDATNKAVQVFHEATMRGQN